MLDVVGPFEVFATANDVLDEQASRARRYAVSVVSVQGGQVRSDHGLALGTVRVTRDPVDTLVVAGGRGARDSEAGGRLDQLVRARA
ncbi:hypothetical protein [Blastococcus sp. Marseille-P5729]|uniref:hypothetical protein n=1 Tax=Blastococcus sp. Marseille-P5729 TaxID=2086582 RepID=UPI00131CA135|nr:hypothetical protein [Blastococcus sp. Marseille-P5729]